MAVSAAQADAAVRAAVAALQRRDPKTARRLFADLAAAAPDLAPPWLLIAQACRMDGDATAEEEALDRLLAREPRHVRGLVMKGDCRARQDDDRAATSFYHTALAAADGAAISPTIAADLDRVQAYLAQTQRRYEEHLLAALQGGGVDARAIGGRFAQSIDILCGRAEPYLQQPTSFYYPGLPNIQFYERAEFAWMPALEAAAPAMRAELEALLAEGGHGFAPYIEASPDRPRSINPLFGDPSWSALYLWRGGALVEENARRLPGAVKALEGAPLPFIAGRSPMALLSSLRPGTHIAPHHGLLNTRLICHLPLIVPPGCRFRVGNETRMWEEGRTLIFDDSIEHEAWNDGTLTRIVLLFEIWRPELAAEERAALTTLYQAIDLYRGDA